MARTRKLALVTTEDLRREQHPNVSKRYPFDFLEQQEKKRSGSAKWPVWRAALLAVGVSSLLWGGIFFIVTTLQ